MLTIQQALAIGDSCTAKGAEECACPTVTFMNEDGACSHKACEWSEDCGEAIEVWES